MKIFNAIRKINPDAKVAIRGSDIDTCEIEWLDGTAEISKVNIKAKMVELEEEYDANQYQRDRAKEYPSWQEQMDMQYWDNVNSTTTWKDAIAKVKSDNPKG